MKRKLENKSNSQNKPVRIALSRNFTIKDGEPWGVKIDSMYDGESINIGEVCFMKKINGHVTVKYYKDVFTFEIYGKVEFYVHVDKVDGKYDMKGNGKDKCFTIDGKATATVKRGSVWNGCFIGMMTGGDSVVNFF